MNNNRGPVAGSSQIVSMNKINVTVMAAHSIELCNTDISMESEGINQI